MKEKGFGKIREAWALVWGSADEFVRRRLVWALMLVVVTSVVTALAPVALKLIVDSFAAPGTGSSPVLFALALAYILSQWASRVLGEVRSYVDAQVDRRMYRALSEQLFNHVLWLPLRFHLQRRTGALSETLTNGLMGYQIVLQHMVYTVIPVAIELVTVAIILTSLNHTGFLLIFFVALFAYVWAFWYGTAHMTVAASEASNTQIDERAVMTDAIINYETVKYFAAEPLMRKRFGMALARTEQDWMRFFTKKTANGILVATVFAAFFGVTTSYAIHQVLRGGMTIGDFVLVNAYILQMVRPVEMLGFAVQGLTQGIAFLEKMMELLRVAPEHNSSAGVSFSTHGELRFESVRASYGEERRVLKDISFTVPSGRTLGIVGASGAGKSTLVRLLVRLIEPDSGRILLDGVPIPDISLHALRGVVAVVPQDTVLFNDTIGYNIGFGKPGCSQDEIEQAARIAHLHDFIASLPEGYATNVGERGLKLSGGEKQRVSIARAVLKQPRIYVFDEATSSLDSRTEADILTNLKDISRTSTTLIIAHRLSTIVHADQIVVLDAGTIVEQGTHETLLAVDGRYAALWRAQQKEAATKLTAAISA